MTKTVALSRLSRLRSELLAAGESFSPRECIFYPTMKCNLSCHMCFQRDQRGLFRPELTCQQIRELFSRLPIKSVFLVGGEIFLRPDIIEIFEVFCDLKIRVSFQTNGTFFREGQLEHLMQFDHIDGAWVSLDGLEQSHEAIRGTGTFKKTTDTISLLARKFPVTVNTVILPTNIEELPGVLALAEEMRARVLSLQFQMIYSEEDYRHSCVSHPEAIMRRDTVRDRVDLSYVRKLEDIVPEMLAARKSTRLRFFPQLFMEDLEGYINGTIVSTHTVGCRDLIEARIKINPRGELMLCEAMKNPVGSLMTHSLDELWTSAEARNVRRRFTSGDLSRICGRCCGVTKRG